MILLDGTEATFEKRGGPLGLALQSLRPQGYSRESFMGKEAHPLDEKRLGVLKDFVARGMKMLDTPGVGLAPSYENPALGGLRILKEGQSTLFDAGEWKSAVASRKNDDGTISFITIDPTISGFEFVVADKDG